MANGKSCFLFASCFLPPASCSCFLLLLLLREISSLNDGYLCRIDVTAHRCDNLLRCERFYLRVEVRVELQCPLNEKVVIQTAGQLVVLGPTDLARLQVT